MALTKALLGQLKDDASGTGLTVTVNSTGYEFLVVFFKHEGAPSVITVTDNKGSGTLTPLTKVNHTNADLSGQMHHKIIGTPGSGHDVTFTLAAARAFRFGEVWGIHSSTAATIVYDNNESFAQGSDTAHDAGSLTTTAAAASFQAVSGYAVQAHSPGTGWTEDTTNDATAGYNYGESRTDASPGTFDPTCTSDTSSDFCAVSASFRESAGGGGGGTTNAGFRSLLGVGK